MSHADQASQNESVFLSAEWRDLVMLNYEVSPELLEPHVPRGTAIDAAAHERFHNLALDARRKLTMVRPRVPLGTCSIRRRAAHVNVVRVFARKKILDPHIHVAILDVFLRQQLSAPSVRVQRSWTVPNLCRKASVFWVAFARFACA